MFQFQRFSFSLTSVGKEIFDHFDVRRENLWIFQGESSIVYLYLKKTPLAFSQSLYGVFRGLKSFGLGLGLLIFLPLLRYLFHLNDLTCAMIGTLSKCFCDFLYAIGNSTKTIFFSKINEKKTFVLDFLSVPFVGMFSSYVVVGVRSYLSKICHDDDEGPMTLRKTFRFLRRFSRNSFRKNLFDFGVTRSDRCVDRIGFLQHSLRTFDQFISKFHLRFRCDFSFVNFADFHVSFVLKEKRRYFSFFKSSIVKFYFLQRSFQRRIKRNNVLSFSDYSQWRLRPINFFSLLSC